MTNNDNPFEVDDILVESYGYNMTLYTFYKVVKVTPKSVKIRELKKNRITSGFMPYVVPSSDFANDKIITKRVKFYRSDCYLSTECGIIDKWNEKPLKENHLD